MRQPPVSFDPGELLNILRGLPAAQRYWVGFSGGLDSTVLLAALARRRVQLTGELHAVHVNHHLNTQSGEWQKHCQIQCAALSIHLVCRDANVEAGRGQSLEATARAGRYAVYRELLRPGDLLLLAQHQDDQMETFLLQALRGAGPAGLAAMPQLAVLGEAQLARPLLGFTRGELQAWAQAESLSWIEDPSNANQRFDRNYLRHAVIPLIRRRWPSAGVTFDRSARHCAEAAQLLTELAVHDWEQCVDGDGRSLPVRALQVLGSARAKNLLRYWFVERLKLTPPPAHKLEQVFSTVLAARADRNPCVSWQSGELRRYRYRLYALHPLPEVSAPPAWLRPGTGHATLGGLGRLGLSACTGAGLRAADCPSEGFRVGFRAGGESCRPAGRAHRRPLKKWLQEMGVVPWMRERLPLIYAGEQLAAVADLFVCEPFAAQPGEPGLRVEWQAHPPVY